MGIMDNGGRDVYGRTRSRSVNMRTLRKGIVAVFSLVAIGTSGCASADRWEDLADIYLIKEVIEQVESGEIADLGIAKSFIADEFDRTLRAQKIKAEFDIALEKSQIRRKIKDCVNHQVRDCR